MSPDKHLGDKIPPNIRKLQVYDLVWLAVNNIETPMTVYVGQGEQVRQFFLSAEVCTGNAIRIQFHDSNNIFVAEMIVNARDQDAYQKICHQIQADFIYIH